MTHLRTLAGTTLDLRGPHRIDCSLTDLPTWQPRTQLLHESMALMTEAVGDIKGREFTRIVPPCPDPLMKPLSAAKPIRVWVLFVEDYQRIYDTYTHDDRRVAREEIKGVKRSSARTLLNLKDQDVDDTKCALDLMRTLVSSRHIGKLRQLGFRGEHVILVRDDASIRPFDDRVTIEELLRHGDKTQPLVFARAPPGVDVGASAYPENQMSGKAAHGPLIFRNTVMSAKTGDSLKSAFAHTLRPRKSLAGSPSATVGLSSTHYSTADAHSRSGTRASSEAGTQANGGREKIATGQAVLSDVSADKATLSALSVSSHPPAMGDHGKSSQNQSTGAIEEKGAEIVQPPTEEAPDVGRSALQSWLPTFQHLLTCYNQTKNEANTNLTLRTEQIKRRSLLHREVAKLLAGMPAEHLFHDAVDALEQKTRSDMLEEVATEFCVLGLLVRTLQSTFKMAESGLDLVGCCETFLNQVKTLLKAQHVRLWMVDPKNAQIWEWVANEKHPRKRSIFAAASETMDLSNFTTRKIVQKTGIAAVVARMGVPINVPFPAVQSDSFSIEIDRLPGENALTILCEPIRHRGEIIAVVQCYNKMSDSEEMVRLDEDTAHPPFTSVDEHIIRMLCDNMAELIWKCRKFHTVMTSPEYTLHGTGLTWNYPCTPTDLFELGQSYLDTVRDTLQAQHCILYVLSTNAIKGDKKLWTACPDGRHGRRYVGIGQGIVGWVAEKHQSLNVTDVSKDVRFQPHVDAAYTDPASATGEPLASFKAVNALAVPLTNHDGSMLGVCLMLNKETAPFSRFDESMLQLQCQHVVLMVKTVHANFTHFAAEETITEALYRCMHLVECERTHLFLSEIVERKGKEHRQLRLYASSDEYMSGLTTRMGEMPPIEVPFSDGLLGYTARTGREITLPDARSDPRFNTKIDDSMQYRTSSLMSIPFNDAQDHTKTLGVLLIANKHGASAFSRMDNTMARIFSRMLAILYGKALDEDEVRKAAA